MKHKSSTIHQHHFREKIQNKGYCFPVAPTFVHILERSEAQNVKLEAHFSTNLAQFIVYFRPKILKGGAVKCTCDFVSDNSFCIIFLMNIRQNTPGVL